MLLLGLDGGGTKTDVVLANERGEVIARAVGGAASLTGQEEKQAFEHIEQTLLQALQSVGGLSAPVDALFAGISGGGLEQNRAKFRAFFEHALPNLKRLSNASDCVCALSAAVGTGDGVIAIAGTGSSVFARVKGEMHQVGGWGYLLGDEGSGFDLGRRALTAALKCLDGRARKTILLQMCEEKAQSSLRDLIARLYASDSKRLIADYAPILLKAAECNDPTALLELTQSTGEMAHAIDTAAAFIDEKRVAVGGSLWKNVLYTTMVQKQTHSPCDWIVQQNRPVCGAVYEAAQLAGITVDSAFRNRLENALHYS